MRENLIHFVDLDGSGSKTKDLDLLKYLAIRSAHAVNSDYEIILHCDYIPGGLFWDLVKNFTRIIPIRINGDPRFRLIERIQHKADLLRLLILQEHGGIYLDTDVICLKRFDAIAKPGVIMGKEQRYIDGKVLGLCNAVIMAPKGSRFVDLWLDAYEGFHNEQWGEFSVQLPWTLAQQYPDLIHVEPVTSFFYPSGWPEGIYSLFGDVDDYPNAYTFHLWRSASSEYVDNLSLEKIFTENTTLNNAVRAYVKEDFRFTEESTAAGLLSNTNMQRSGRLLEMAFRSTKMTVQSGPFSGIRLAQRAMLADGDLCAKLLGSYEKELHDIIARARERSYDAIVNIGCGDGFYVVGLAKLFCGVPVFGFDHNETAQRITAENAILNGQSERIQVGGLLSADRLIDIASAYDRLLVLADIDGGERELLGDAGVARALGSCDLIIETHDFRDKMITPAIWEKYTLSHKIEVIHHIGRDPNSVTFLANFSEIERWRAICEYREATQHWLFCSSRDPHRYLMRKSLNRLMTAHGTIVYVDNIDGKVRHGFPDIGSNNVSLLCEGLSGRMVYERGGFLYSVVCDLEESYVLSSTDVSGPTVFDVVQLAAGEIGLRANGMYLCAEADGRVILSRPHCRRWESFRRLPF